MKFHGGSVAIERVVRSVSARGRWLVPVLILVIAVRRWFQIGAYPSGVDEGHWLAFGKAYVGQDNDISRLFPRCVMPPGVPLMLEGLATLVGPLPAARLIAAASVAALSLAVYFVTSRSVGPWSAGVSAALLSSSIVVSDPTAWGGYPQNFALAALVMTAYATARFLSSPTSLKSGAFIGLSALCVSLTHHAFYGVAVLVACTVVLTWVTTAGRWRELATVKKAALCSLWFLPSLICFVVVIIALRSGHYEPAVNAADSSLVKTLRYLTPYPSWAWELVVVGGFLGLGLTTARRADPSWTAASALTFVGLAMFVPSEEPRFLAVTAAGLVIGFGVGLSQLHLWMSGRGFAGLCPAGAAFALIILVFTGDSRAADAFRWFETVSPAYVEAAGWLEAQDQDQSAVAIRTDNRGWPVGWWLRGLTNKEVLVGSDQRWLGFKAEKLDAQVVEHLFADDGSTPADIAADARRNGIGWIAFRRDQWFGWHEWLGNSDQLPIVFENAEYVILEVPRGSANGTLGD